MEQWLSMLQILLLRTCIHNVILKNRNINVMRNSGSLKGCNGQYIRSRLDTNTVVENQDERQEKAGSYWYFGMMELWIRYH